MILYMTGFFSDIPVLQSECAIRIIWYHSNSYCNTSDGCFKLFQSLSFIQSHSVTYQFGAQVALAFSFLCQIVKAKPLIKSNWSHLKAGKFKSQLLLNLLRVGGQLVKLLSMPPSRQHQYIPRCLPADAFQAHCKTLHGAAHHCRVFQGFQNLWRIG